MSYMLPFNQGDRVLELGGGENPLQVPGLTIFNVDKRPLPTVDAVRDLEEDFTDVGKFNGLYCAYMAEHISWRKITQFFERCFKVLNDGGVALFVVPNTLEQIRRIASKNDVTLEDSCFLFGDQDYSDNTHKVLFSKPLITKLLKDVGFSEVKITDHPNTEAADMFVEARKSSLSANIYKPQRTPEEMYDRRYFEDPDEGYVGFWDFPIHFNIMSQVKVLNPESVLDVGAGRGYIVKHLEAQGIRAVAMDVSSHCHHTRATDSFVLHDATDIPWPFEDKEFDLVFSSSFMEHLPEEKIVEVVKEMERVSKRSYHLITFEITPQDIDSTHRQGTIKPHEWWMNIFWVAAPDYPTKIMTQSDFNLMNQTPIQLPPDDGLKKVNFGSYTVQFYYGWINSDIQDLTDFARKTGRKFVQHDVRQPSPLNDNSVHCITAHHLMEHLTREEGANFLKECYRIMEPGGVIRLSVPDTRKIIGKYIQGDVINDYKVVNVGVEQAQDETDAFFKLLFEGHKTLYDATSLSDTMQKAGFAEGKLMPFNQSRSDNIQKETIDSFPTLSLYCEGIKPHGLNTTPKQGPTITVEPELQPYQKYLTGVLKEGSQRASD